MSYTSVSAQVKDPSGNLYAGGKWEAAWINQSIASGVLPTMSGAQPGQFQTFINGVLDSFGNLGPVLMADCNTITPGPSQWNFVITDFTSRVSFSVLITITGASQNISAALQAAAASLITTFFGPTNFSSITTATLTVSGNQTIGGTLGVTGATTLSSMSTSGNATVGGTLGVTGNTSLSTLGVSGLSSLGTVTATGNVTATAGQNTIALYSLDGIPIVDGNKYTTLSAAYNALPSTGGTVIVGCAPGGGQYTETLSANLVLSKPDAGFQFKCGASISMGTNSVTKASGINGGFIDCDGLNCGWAYTGSGTAFLIGDSSGNSQNFSMRNFHVDIAGAGVNAVGIDLVRVQNPTLYRTQVNCAGTGTGQVGLLLDGTGNFTGDGAIIAFTSFSCFSGIRFTGSGGTAANGNLIITPALVGIGAPANNRQLDFLNGNGNTVINPDIEGAATAVNFNGVGVFGNRVINHYGGGNTTDVNFAGNQVGNSYELGGGTSAPPVVTGTIGDSTVWYRGHILQQSISRVHTLSGTQVTGCAVTGAGASGTCAPAGGISNTDSFAVLRISAAGAGPAASGTVTITLSSGLGSFAFCSFTPANGNAAWNARATVFQTSYSNSTPVGAWDNNAVALVAGNNYDIIATCVGH